MIGRVNDQRFGQIDSRQQLSEELVDGPGNRILVLELTSNISDLRFGLARADKNVSKKPILIRASETRESRADIWSE